MKSFASANQLAVVKTSAHTGQGRRWEKTLGISGGLLWVADRAPRGGSGRLVDSEMDADDVLKGSENSAIPNRTSQGPRVVV